MQEYNLLNAYPQPGKPRYVGPRIRTIQNRIQAAARDHKYYDGDRRNGYGGFKYDGRWKAIAERAIERYGLTEKSSVLQVGPEKGFLMHEFKQLLPGMKIRGFEISTYAAEQSMPSVKSLIQTGHYRSLPYQDKEFDLVLAIGVIYTLTLADALSCLREIGRVGNGKSFLTLGSFRNEQEEKLFRNWTVLGSTVLHVNDWAEVLRAAEYTGDYFFMTAKELNLEWTEKDWSEVQSG